MISKTNIKSQSRSRSHWHAPPTWDPLLRAPITRILVRSCPPLGSSILFITSKLRPVLTALGLSKHSEQAQVIRGLQGASGDERDPEVIVGAEDARDDRTHALREGLNEVDGAHHSRPFMREHNRRQKRRSRPRVHDLSARSADQEDQRPRECGWDWNQCEADR